MKFKCTEDALEFGRNASLSQIRVLEKQYRVAQKVFNTLFEYGKIDYGFLMRIATDCQFVREAIESYYNNQEN